MNLHCLNGNGPAFFFYVCLILSFFRKGHSWDFLILFALLGKNDRFMSFPLNFVCFLYFFAVETILDRILSFYGDKLLKIRDFLLTFYIFFSLYYNFQYDIEKTDL